MSWTRRAWIVAASVGAVETLKDQLGLCRWDYTIRCINQHAKTNIIRSLSQAQTRLFSQSSSSSSMVGNTFGVEKLRQSEEPMRKIMYLSCWAIS
ncbi:Protein of unknown function wound-induced [Dillenia turbinata]|uniref:Wound-responsive family protein n=1 Tax=Dillenia turbinata TaxID=194707 RepID=A0AAN8UXL4_9MAGN